MKDFLTAREVNNLKSTHRFEKDRKKADRIKTILALNEGLTYEQVAKILLLDEATIRRYEKEYEKNGVDGLLEDHYHGSIGHLTSGQEIELTSYLKTHLHQTAKEIRLHIEKIYGVHYSVEGVTNLLHRLKFVYKKTKIVPGKVDPGLQRCFSIFMT